MAEYKNPKQVGIEEMKRGCWHSLAARQSRYVFTEEEIERLTRKVNRFVLMDNRDNDRFLWGELSEKEEKAPQMAWFE